MKIPFIKTLQDVDKLLKVMNIVHMVLGCASLAGFLVSLLVRSYDLMVACALAAAVFGGLFVSTNSLRMAVMGIDFRRK